MNYEVEDGTTSSQQGGQVWKGVHVPGVPENVVIVSFDGYPALYLEKNANRAPAPQVGGSLAGLMHGIQLKRHGSRVTILEQDPSAERQQSQAAGIGFGVNMKQFLRRYDVTNRQVSLPLTQVRFSVGTMAWSWSRLPIKRDLTSWGHLYRILRMNLEAEDVDSGSVDYRAGKRVDGLQYPDRHGGVTVQYSDVKTGVRESASADFVIGADGIHSTMHGLLHAHVRKQYAGYVVWRGTVPEEAVSTDTLRFFSMGLGVEMLWKSYMIW